MKDKERTPPRLVRVNGELVEHPASIELATNSKLVNGKWVYWDEAHNTDDVTSKHDNPAEADEVQPGSCP